MPRGDNMRKFGALRERIKNSFDTQQNFAKAMNMNVATLNLKLNGKAIWKLGEIEKACSLLDISKAEITSYFFY